MPSLLDYRTMEVNFWQMTMMEQVNQQSQLVETELPLCFHKTLIIDFSLQITFTTEQ